METVFALSFLLVTPFWVLMIFLPHWSWTQRIVGSAWIAAPAALLYTVLVLPRVAEILPKVAQPTLAGVRALLGAPDGATIGWVHFLAFDVFVARWAYLDSRVRSISAWLMAPVLFLTLMLGPMGLLVYLGLRGRR